MARLPQADQHEEGLIYIYVDMSTKNLMSTKEQQFMLCGLKMIRDEITRYNVVPTCHLMRELVEGMLTAPGIRMARYNDELQALRTAGYIVVEHNGYDNELHVSIRSVKQFLQNGDKDAMHAAMEAMREAMPEVVRVRRLCDGCAMGV